MLYLISSLVLFFHFTFVFSENLAIPKLEKEVEKSLQEHIHYDPVLENNVGYLSLEKDRGIDQSTYIYFKFALEYFKKKGVQFILLKLNTPGGEVFASQKICSLLQDIDFQDHIPVVALIDNWAISAGAMIAYSCRYIAVTSSSSMGAAEPIVMSQQGDSQTASEKINSALRSEFTNLARFYDRDPLIAEAMVDKDMILVIREGKFEKLYQEKEIKDTDTIVSPKGKLLTLNAKQLIDYGVADFEVSLKKSSSNQERKEEESLLFTFPFFAKMQHVKLLTYQNWRVSFFSFLSHPLISSLLMMGLIIGFYIEMSTPGFGIFGTIALFCLALILLSSFSIYTILWIDLILFLAGVGLILVEVFIIPGFGFIGILGGILFLVGLFTLMLPKFSGANFTFDFSFLSLAALDVLYHLAWFCGAFIAAVIVIIVLSRYLSPLFFRYSPLILRDDPAKKVEESPLPKIGEKGEVFSSLRPSGKVMINDDIFDAISEREYIEKGESIIVIEIRSKNLIVRKSK